MADFEPHHPPRQTSSFLRQRMAAFGLRPEIRYGQNFLIDLNLLEVILDAARLTAQDVVLEVGTGTAGLTTRLAQQARHVVTVEIDAQLAQLAAENLGTSPNVTFLRQDVLKNKSTVDPRVMQAVSDALHQHQLTSYKLVANLPYNIATPLVSNLLAADLRPALMVITIQKEVADRMMAQPGSKDYGALSVWVQSLATVELVRVLPPTVFWPRPKVDSAILRIELQEAWRQELPDVEFFHSFVRALFFHRRKFLRSVLISATKEELDKSAVDRVLADQELDPTLRAEQLDVPTIHRLVEAFRQARTAQ